MKPSELYKRAPEISGSDYWLCGMGYGTAVSEEVGEYPSLEFESHIKEDERFVVNIYKKFNFDGERIWKLGSIYFDGYPCLIFQAAGRGGCDHQDRYITDEVVFNAMISYLRNLKSSEEGDEQIHDPEMDIPHLSDFYGSSLDGPFEHCNYSRYLMK